MDEEFREIFSRVHFSNLQGRKIFLHLTFLFTFIILQSGDTHFIVMHRRFLLRICLKNAQSIVNNISMRGKVVY